MTDWNNVSRGYVQAARCEIYDDDLLIITKYAIFSGIILLSTNAANESQREWLKIRLKSLIQSLHN